MLNKRPSFRPDNTSRTPNASASTSDNFDHRDTFPKRDYCLRAAGPTGLYQILAISKKRFGSHIIRHHFLFRLELLFVAEAYLSLVKLVVEGPR